MEANSATVAVTSSASTSQMQRAYALPRLTSLASTAAAAPAVVGAKANNTFFVRAQFGLAFDRVRTATPASCCLVFGRLELTLCASE